MKKQEKMLGLGLTILTLFTGCGAEKSLREYEKGILAYEEADYEAAAECFESALGQNPDKAEYYLYYGYTLLQLGEYEDAQKQFEKAMLDKEFDAIRDNTKRAYRGAGIAAYYKQDWQQAMIYLDLAYQMEELPELNEDIRAYMRQISEARVDNYLAVGAYESAAELCESIESEYGVSKEISVIQGTIAYVQGDVLGAAKEYEQAVLAGEETPQVRIAMIANYLDAIRKGQLSAEEVESCQDKIAAELEKMAKAHSDRIGQEECVALGYLCFASGEYELAKPWLNEAAENAADAAELAGVNKLLAQIAIQENDYEEALRLLQNGAVGALTENDYYRMAFCAAKADAVELAWSYHEAGAALSLAETRERWDRLSLYLNEQTGAYQEAYKELERYIEDYMTADMEEWEVLQKELAYLKYRSE